MRTTVAVACRERSRTVPSRPAVPGRPAHSQGARQKFEFGDAQQLCAALGNGPKRSWISALSSSSAARVGGGRMRFVKRQAHVHVADVPPPADVTRQDAEAAARLVAAASGWFERRLAAGLGPALRLEHVQIQKRETARSRSPGRFCCSPAIHRRRGSRVIKGREDESRSSSSITRSPRDA